MSNKGLSIVRPGEIDEVSSVLEMVPLTDEELERDIPKEDPNEVIILELERAVQELQQECDSLKRELDLVTKESDALEVIRDEAEFATETAQEKLRDSSFDLADLLSDLVRLTPDDALLRRRIEQLISELKGPPRRDVGRDDSPLLSLILSRPA